MGTPTMRKLVLALVLAFLGSTTTSCIIRSDRPHRGRYAVKKKHRGKHCGKRGKCKGHKKHHKGKKYKKHKRRYR